MYENNIRCGEDNSLILPFVIEATGFYRAGEPIMDALYSSLALYPINMSSGKRNILIEIARWTAPLATAGGLFLIFRSALVRLTDAIKTISGGVTAVYGNSHYAETFRRNVKKSVRGSSERISGAEDHVLLFNTEMENLAFYDAHEKEFRDKPGVYPLETAAIRESRRSTTTPNTRRKSLEMEY